MLPRIEAMEQLSAIEARAMAMGSADDPVRRERFDRLRSVARGEITAGADNQRPKKATADQAAEMGLGVIMIPPKEPGNG